MAKFILGYDGAHGFNTSHPDVYATIELSDEQLDRLVALIRETGKTDVYSMELDEIYPDIFEILDDACRDAVYNCELREAEMNVAYEELSEWSDSRILFFARGYRFKCDSDDYYKKVQSARDWIIKCLEEDDDNLDEFIDIIGWQPDDWYVEYDIVIPDEILHMAGVK